MRNVACAAVAASALMFGCGGDDSEKAFDLAPKGGDMAVAQSLYDKYGGAPTIKKVVDDAVTGLLGDCVEAPYFAVIGQSGHDSVARLKGCLVLQFTVALGGPGAYPGTNSEGDMCEDMMTAHDGLGIPGDVFDRFIMDLGSVLEADGVSAADTTTIAGALTGFKTQIVASTPIVHDACVDGGS